MATARSGRAGSTRSPGPLPCQLVDRVEHPAPDQPLSIDPVDGLAERVEIERQLAGGKSLPDIVPGIVDRTGRHGTGFIDVDEPLQRAEARRAYVSRRRLAAA